MLNAQEIANRIGETQRATEAAIASGDLAVAAALAQQQHGNLAEGFAFLRDEAGLDLDWDQVAGNARAKGAQTNGGGSKDPPPPND